MARKVFISFNFKDKVVAKNVVSFFQEQGRACQGSPLFADRDVSAGGERAITDEIQRVMRQASLVLFVVGDDSHNSPWINYEAQLARSWDLQMVAVQAPSTTGGLPKELLEEGISFVKWTEDALCNALNKVRGKV